MYNIIITGFGYCLNALWHVEIILAVLYYKSEVALCINLQIQEQREATFPIHCVIHQQILSM